MDVICAQCGEPWEYYGVNHGDFEQEDIEPFLRGECCPCCRNHPGRQTGQFFYDHFNSLIEASDDIEEFMDSLPSDTF